MKVYFIGAGPGAPDLITIRGAKILGEVPLVLYAGSLVPTPMLEHCGKDAEIIDTAQLNLDEQEQHFVRAFENGWDVARLHSGDPSIYGAMAEQMRRLDARGIEYEVIPGVSSFCAAAASIAAELTAPEISQTVILTRVSGRASAVPERESLTSLASHHASMCIFLSGPHLARIQEELLTHYPPTTPAALVHRASWPDERTHTTTLGQLLENIEIKDWSLTTILLVGDVLANDFKTESRLYAATYAHRFRKAVDGREQ